MGVVCIVALVTVVAFTMPVSALSGGDGNDRLDTFPPGSVYFPGDTYAGTPAGKRMCST